MADDLTLVVPDIHERIPLVELILKHFLKRVARVIFLGDYFDSWTKTTDTTKATCQWLAANYRDPRFTFLLGNHDLQYLWPRIGGLRCSGYTDVSLRIVKQHLPLNVRWALQDPRGRVFAEAGGYLLSHAGLHPKYLRTRGQQTWSLAWGRREEMQAYSQLKTNSAPSWLWAAGWDVGGHAEVGGPVWLRWQNLPDDPSLPPQIVGHTEVPMVAYRGRNVNLDTSLRQVGLLTASGQFAVEPTSGLVVGV